MALLRLCLLFIFALSLAACAPDEGTPAERAATRGDAEPSEVKPRLGMTKVQVLQTYGDPDDKVVGPKGEAWRYIFSTGFWSGSARIGVLYFDNEGKLKDFIFNK